MSDSALLVSLRALAVRTNEILTAAPHLAGTGFSWRWERKGQGVAVGSPLPSLFPLANRGLDRLPEFQACEQAMRADPLIGPSADQLVGSVRSASMLQVPTVVLQLLNHSIIDGQVSIAALDDELERFREFFRSDTAEARSFIGVFGVMLADGPIDLPDGIRLNITGSDDLDLLIQTGVGETSQRAPMVTASAHRTVSGLPDVIAEIRHVLPVRLAGDTDPPKAESLASPDMHQPGDQLVEALALLKTAPIARTGVVIEDLNWFANGCGWSEHPQRSSRPDAQAHLGTADIAPLTRLYKLLGSPRVIRRKHLQLALRRFVLALSREREDDRLIDLAIATEALLLDHEGELSLRLALRAATLAEGTPLSPREVYERMRTAYRVRSKVVHGANIPTETIKVARIGLESDLRHLLAEYLRLASKTDGSNQLKLDEARYLPGLHDS